MSFIKIKQIKKLHGTIEVPGDKSISHRACIIGSIANGVTHVSNFLKAEDTLRTVKMFQDMGVDIKLRSNTLIIQGRGLNSLREPKDILDSGNSGTTARLMLGILAGQNFTSTITGDDYLKKRPMLRVVEPLRKMGARIEGNENGNFLPLTVRGAKLSPISYELNIASAQVKSAILLASLFADGETIVKERVISRDHTERMLKLFGANINKHSGVISVKGNPYLKGQSLTVPGDFSSAAFFIVAGILLKNAKIVIKNVGINPTRTGLYDILKKIGANITIENYSGKYQEPRGDIVAEGGSELKGIEIGDSIIPKLIDEIPVLAVAACLSNGRTIIKDAKELRVKESDRISSMVTELKKMGAKIEELPDGMIIDGVNNLSGAECNSHGDHRVAMALSIAGFIAEGETKVDDTDCINTSFPEFLDCIEKLTKY